MGRPKPPTPPDPYKVAGAQTGTNIATAIANSTMGMVDQVTPDGSLTNEVVGYETITDPSTGTSYKVPKYRQTTSLSAAGQAIKDQTDQAQLGLATTANQQAGFLKDYLGKPFNADTAAIEGRLDELMRSRADPRFAREEEALRTRLANQGIAPGSEAYSREMQSFGQNRNDAYNQMYLQGRGQAFSELQALRNQPINEITALLSGSQVSNPNVQAVQPQGMPTVDLAGLINENYNQRLNAWQQNAANQQSLLGGLFGIGGKLIGGGLF